MNLKELDLVNEEGRRRIALFRSGVQAPESAVRAFGYFELDMFECPPFVMFSNGDVPVLTYVMATGAFEPGSMALWCRLAKTATGFLDIGANVGIYSLAAAKLRPDIDVNAIEPNPYAYARLRVHKFLNDLPNLIEHPFAVYSRAGVSLLTWVKKPHGNISSGARLSVGDPMGTESLPVNVRPIDGSGLAATLGQRPLVKIDVEGGEATVFGAMQEVIALRPDIILETFEPKACEAINKTLLPMGYSVYGIDEAAKALRRKPELAPCSRSDTTHNFNQFMTVRTAAEIEGIITVA